MSGHSAELRCPTIELAPGQVVRGLRLGATPPNVLEFQVDAEIPRDTRVNVRLFRPNGKVTELRLAAQACNQPQYLDSSGNGRLQFFGQGRHYLRCWVGDRAYFEAIDVATVDGRLETKTLRPTEREWQVVVLEDLPAAIPTRTIVFDDAGNEIWIRASQLKAGRFKVPKTGTGWRIEALDERGVEHVYVATLEEIRSAGEGPLVLQREATAD